MKKPSRESASLIWQWCLLALAASVAACATPPRAQDLPSAQSPPPDVNSEAIPARTCSFDNGPFAPDANQFAVNHFPLTGFPQNPFINQCWPN